MINLPRIAVLGQQSSGKSSVLENIVGIDFLPRGAGVCTRRPLELRLVHESEPSTKAWAKFGEVPDRKFTDFEEVRSMIEKLTDKVAGKNKNIVDDPITLTVHSHTCPDLTLVDLPGITRIPLRGSDQKQDIEKVTKDMAMRYVGDPRTIVLCVIPANADMTTSDGLQMARQVDPKGVRTIGVITKIDIMDRGTNAKSMILGHEVPLRLGYVGVKNRSQLDIDENKRVFAALNEEKLYFSKHPVYSTMPQDLLGTHNLTKKLTKVLFTHIKNYLPEIVKEINALKKDMDEKLRNLGPPLPSEKHEKMQLLWNMVNEFCASFKNVIGGRVIKQQAGKDKQLTGGARIKTYYGHLYEEYVDHHFSVTAEYSDPDIERAIKQYEGYSMPGFPSVDVFNYLLQPELNRLKDPAMDCLQDVYLYLENLAEEIANRVFARFPGLVGEVIEVVSKVLSEERDKTKDFLEDIIEAEQSYLFTNDYDYLMNRSDIISSQAVQNQSRQMDAKAIFIRELRIRIDTYFKLVIRNVRDRVPKTIGYFLVQNC
jgi:dynamin 1-like protein